MISASVPGVSAARLRPAKPLSTEGCKLANVSKPAGLRASAAFIVLLAAGAVVLLVNEISHTRIVRTLRGGIALTDARIASLRCLQLLTDAETAQRGYLLTGRDADLAPYRSARAELPQVLEPTLQYLATGGAANAAAADRVRTLITDKLAELNLTVSLVEIGRRAAALDIVASDHGAARMASLRQAFGTALARAAAQQEAARSDIYRTLEVNRIVVAALTVAGLLVGWLFLRQRFALDAERALQQARLEAEVEKRTLDLRQLAGHLQHLREDERARVARELHDEMGGLLSALKLDVLRLRNLRDVPPTAAERLAGMGARLDDVIALKRRVIEDLHPSALDMLGLKASIEALCNDAADGLGIPVTQALEAVELPESAQLTAYRLVQESLTNIRKYAQATEVGVRLFRDGRSAVLEVRDNGLGFDVDAVRSGRHGLAGMRYRVESHGGTMAIESAPGSGTTLRATLPEASNG